jgi:YidC/Oxa1 family membrane protein insertase
MENQRIFLWIAFALVAWLTWQAWVKDYQRPPPETPATTSSPEKPPAVAEELPELPSGTTAQPVPEGTSTAGQAQLLHVKTDVYDITLSTEGGDLQTVVLSDYPVHKSQPNILVQLLDDDPADYFAIRSGLRAAGGGEEPNHQATYQAKETEYILQEGEDTLVVPLIWRGAGGLTVTKTYTFNRGSYAIHVQYRVENASGEEWGAASYVQLRRRNVVQKRSMTNVDTYSFRGPVVYDGDKYRKLKVKDLAEDPLQMEVSGGWVASIQHHFLGAAIPPTTSREEITARVRDDVYTLTAVGEVTPVPAGAVTTFDETLFVGPKLQRQLEKTAPGLRLTVDYGFLTVIAQPLFWLLQKFHALTGNWGWAIIMLTVLIKLLFYKLSETSGKSMAKMRKLQPRLKALQERYKDDRQALSQAMMDLYKREKVNPASGCLPILVQMPVFLALYWVLLESVEMRQAPFMLWINDLSARDPYYVLPLLMGVTMFIQQRLNPAPPDPVQARIMMALPIVFTVFFAFFPAGLVLYWFVNNLLSIAQQWRINKVVEKSA